MKKLLSIVLSVIMAVSMCTVFALPVFAADIVQSPTAPTLQDKKATVTVNGENKQGVVYSPSDSNPSEITFKYDGDGTLTGWESNLADLGLVEGTDYTLVENEDGSITINFLSGNAISMWNNGKVWVNALVDFDEDEEPAEETTKNDSSKSPSTGASTAVLAGSIAAVGAGIAVLAASKKKDAE